MKLKLWAFASRATSWTAWRMERFSLWVYARYTAADPETERWYQASLREHPPNSDGGPG